GQEGKRCTEMHPGVSKEPGVGDEAAEGLEHAEGQQLGVGQLGADAHRRPPSAKTGSALSESSIFTYSAVARVSRSVSTRPPGSNVGAQRRSWMPLARQPRILH